MFSERHAPLAPAQPRRTMPLADSGVAPHHEAPSWLAPLEGGHLLSAWHVLVQGRLPLTQPARRRVPPARREGEYA